MKLRIRFSDTVSVVDAVRDAAQRACPRRDLEPPEEHRARVAEAYRAVREHLATWIDGTAVTVEFDLLVGSARVVAQQGDEPVPEQPPLEDQTENPVGKVADMTSKGKY